MAQSCREPSLRRRAPGESHLRLSSQHLLAGLKGRGSLMVDDGGQCDKERITAKREAKFNGETSGTI